VRQIIIVLIIFLFVCAVPAYGFDGQRKGFVLGGGLGVAAVAHWSVDVDYFDIGIGKADEDRAGIGVQLVIGGAFDEHNMLVYEGNVAGFTSGLLFDESIGQGFSGASWYHYFGSTGRSAFTALGLGLYYFQVSDFEPTNPGGAVLLGGGYEFSPHWQVGAYVTFGKTTESGFGLNADFEHANLSILFSGIAF
jgi:hypothetical protein